MIRQKVVDQRTSIAKLNVAINTLPTSRAKEQLTIAIDKSLMYFDGVYAGLDLAPPVVKGGERPVTPQYITDILTDIGDGNVSVAMTTLVDGLNIDKANFITNVVSQVAGTYSSSKFEIDCLLAEAFRSMLEIAYWARTVGNGSVAPPPPAPSPKA